MASTFNETEPGLKHLALILHWRSEPNRVFYFRFSDSNYEALKAKWILSANAFQSCVNSLVVGVFFFVYVHRFADELLMLKRQKFRCAFLDSALIWFIYLESEMTAESKFHCFWISVCLIVNLWKMKCLHIVSSLWQPHILWAITLKKRASFSPNNSPLRRAMLVTPPHIRLICFCSLLKR